MSKVNIAEKFSLFKSYWDPKIVGELNNQYVNMMLLEKEIALAKSLYFPSVTLMPPIPLI